MELGSSFAELLKIHENLNEMFLRHQEKLLSGDIHAAIALLSLYEVRLIEHMGDEEELLFPLYEERTERLPGGPAELFIGEHKKMRGFIGEFYRALSRMRVKRGRRLNRSIIALMDRQAMYKHLVEHHDLRERNILYPWLDRVSTKKERISLLKKCRRP